MNSAPQPTVVHVVTETSTALGALCAECRHPFQVGDAVTLVREPDTAAAVRPGYLVGVHMRCAYPATQSSLQ